MFATMGQLERANQPFGQYRNPLMTDSKSLAQGSQGLVNAAKTNSASLAPSADG